MVTCTVCLPGTHIDALHTDPAPGQREALGQVPATCRAVRGCPGDRDRPVWFAELRSSQATRHSTLSGEGSEQQPSPQWTSVQRPTFPPEPT